MQSEPHGMNTMVWALPRSLAATYGIIVIFSSSGYLDVSVRRVPSAQLWIHCTVTCSACRVSPFRHPRINAYVQLPAAFRSLSRLSSAPSARASALRPTMLNLLYFRLALSFKKVRRTVQFGSYTPPQANLRCVSFMFFSLACYLLSRFTFVSLIRLLNLSTTRLDVRCVRSDLSIKSVSYSVFKV